MPDWLRRALRFIPAAALAALVFPALTHPAGHLDFSLQNFRLLAGLGGAIIAWKTRNVLLTHHPLWHGITVDLGSGFRHIATMPLSFNKSLPTKIPTRYKNLRYTSDTRNSIFRPKRSEK